VIPEGSKIGSMEEIAKYLPPHDNVGFRCIVGMGRGWGWGKGWACGV